MALATSTDVANRLGRTLTSAEETSVVLLLEGASAIIAGEVDKPDGWTPNPVPGVVKAICIELVCRALANPEGLILTQESLGAHNYHARFNQAGILPTAVEVRILRRVVYGSNAGSARANTLANHIGIWPWDQMVYVDEDLIAS